MLRIQTLYQHRACIYEPLQIQCKHGVMSNDKKCHPVMCHPHILNKNINTQTITTITNYTANSARQVTLHLLIVYLNVDTNIFCARMLYCESKVL